MSNLSVLDLMIIIPTTAEIVKRSKIDVIYSVQRVTIEINRD